MKRIRRTPDQIRILSEQFRGSGLTQRQFARRTGVCVGSVQRWLRASRPSTAPGSPRFVEVLPLPMGQSAESGACRLELPGGLVLCLSRPPSPGYLAAVAAEFRRGA